MFPLGLGRNSAGSCALFGRPSHVPRDCPTPQVQASSPGGGTCAGSLVESGSVGASPGALRACLPAHFSPLCADRIPNPSLRGKVGALRRSLLRQMRGRAHGRRPGLRGVRLRSTASEHCRRPGRRVLLAVRGFLRTGGRLPASAGKRLSRRCSGDFMASPFCRGELPGFSCVSGRMAETQAAGKALSPARSRKRAECGRPGLPHSG